MVVPLAGAADAGGAYTLASAAGAAGTGGAAGVGAAAAATGGGATRGGAAGPATGAEGSGRGDNSSVVRITGDGAAGAAGTDAGSHGRQCQEITGGAFATAGALTAGTGDGDRTGIETYHPPPFFFRTRHGRWRGLRWRLLGRRAAVKWTKSCATAEDFSRSFLLRLPLSSLRPQSRRPGQSEPPGEPPERLLSSSSRASAGPRRERLEVPQRLPEQPRASLEPSPRGPASRQAFPRPLPELSPAAPVGARGRRT